MFEFQLYGIVTVFSAITDMYIYRPFLRANHGRRHIGVTWPSAIKVLKITWCGTYTTAGFYLHVYIW